MGDFDLCGALRRIRRSADLSQRELATAAGLSPSAVAHAEAGTRDLPTRALARAAAVAGLRLVLVDGTGQETVGMGDDTVRDLAGRRFPAHLDTRHSDQGWWHGPHRYSRYRPWYTFDRDRWTRDKYRRRHGTPEDHQLPQPGDSPADRAEVRRREYWRQRSEERERRFLAGDLARLPDAFLCSCPPRCDELDDYSRRPVHAEECPCLCELG
ncbi:helix-turn-helix transcriptional regulator [Blastococcus sp. CT_GayMR16]|uniref:helix-turn-helix domain-containing protein n=1 Tax=Blastococcus sp. CT_GayMR16 TaxID=2559607 RepID=UPI00142FC0D8|nr:helix-turn-helix transcriptional regulator [Blastococcus sp. CT_GayMR16]